MAKARVTTKTKKKQWVPVLAPKIFSNKSLGDTYVLEPKVAVGRTLLYNLREVTDNMKDQNVYLTFRIKAWNNDKLSTEIIGYQVTPAILKRMIRRNTSRIDGVITVKTSDGKDILLKVIIQTRHQTQKSVRTQLLQDVSRRLSEDISKLNYGNLLDKLISHKLQSEMKKVLNKIFPVKNFEVKTMKLILKKKPGEVEEVAEEVEPDSEEAVAEKEAAQEPVEEEKVTEDAVEEKETGQEKVTEKVVEEKVAEQEKTTETITEEKETSLGEETVAEEASSSP